MSPALYPMHVLYNILLCEHLCMIHVLKNSMLRSQTTNQQCGCTIYMQGLRRYYHTIRVPQTQKYVKAKERTQSRYQREILKKRSVDQSAGRSTHLLKLELQETEENRKLWTRVR